MKKELIELIGKLGGEVETYNILTKYVEKRGKSLARRAIRKVEMAEFRAYKAAKKVA